MCEEQGHDLVGMSESVLFFHMEAPGIRCDRLALPTKPSHESTHSEQSIQPPNFYLSLDNEK